MHTLLYGGRSGGGCGGGGGDDAGLSVVVGGGYDVDVAMLVDQTSALILLKVLFLELRLCASVIPFIFFMKRPKSTFNS